MALTQDHIQHILDGYNQENIRYAIDEVSASEWYLGITNRREAFSSSPWWIVFKLVNTGTTVDVFTAGYEFAYVWDDRLTLTYIDVYLLELDTQDFTIPLTAETGYSFGSLVTSGGTSPYTYELIQNEEDIFYLDGAELKLSARPSVLSVEYSVQMRVYDVNGSTIDSVVYNFLAQDLSNQFSIRLNGVDEYLNNVGWVARDHYDLTEFSFSIWVKLDPAFLSIGATIIHYDALNNNAMEFELRAKNQFGLGFEARLNPKLTDSLQTVTAYNTGDDLTLWNHVCVTVDLPGGDFRIYVNGTDHTNAPSKTFTTTQLLQASSAFKIGALATAAKINGWVDEYSFYRKKLSAIEVTELYNSGAPSNLYSTSFTNEMAHWYRLGDEMTTVVPNKSLFTPIYDPIGTRDLSLVNVDLTNKSTDVPL